MFNVKFIGTAVTVPLITEPSETQWEKAFFTEAHCNGVDGFFEFEGEFFSIEHDCWVVDQMSRLYQSLVEFGGKPPTHWMNFKGRGFAIHQNCIDSYTILEFKESY